MLEWRARVTKVLVTGVLVALSLAIGDAVPVQFNWEW